MNQVTRDYFGCQSKGSQFESYIFQPEITDLYLHWKSCFSGERHFSAVCQSGQRSRTRTGVDPEDSSCLKEIDKKVFEYRLHLEKNLNSRDIACPFKVDYRRGKHFIMCLITFLFLSALCLYPKCMFLQDMFSNLHYPDQGGILRRRKQRIFNGNFLSHKNCP